ncbi:DUF927 domain-containing protein [Labrenzia sp. PHM005]|uniref:DUF927 domain-containing protein n=1 Tax=Labrenzia sp. PHM005 TaxID=2590016 RepID=UPI001140357F|nr:DUF927 domain-containing protein [Labrenzia sp. PHM005]QDG74801.1 DUF927 domain-containing protein [Labrenzia sp. PHM005]
MKNSITFTRLQNLQNKKDSVLVTFPRTNNREAGKLVVAVSELSRPQSLREQLLDLGADISLKERFLPDEIPFSKEVGFLTVTPGWLLGSKQVFVLPTVVVGNSTDKVIHFDNQALRTPSTSSAGILDSWKTEVALPAKDSPIASFAIMVALASPLLRFSELTEAAIFNFAGNSSGGKTTACRVAQSVWSDPDKMPTWNATERAMVECAAGHSEIGLILDDVEQASQKVSERSKRVHELTHLLTSGTGKEVTKALNGEYPDLSFKTFILSSSPSLIAEECKKHGYPRTDGDRVRFLEIVVPHGDKGGIWQSIDGNFPALTAQMSDRLTAAARNNHGRAGVAWIRKLCKAEPSKIENALRTRTEGFLKRLHSQGSVETRIAKKIGLICAAAELAVNAKILPWTHDHVRIVAEFAFREIAKNALGVRPNINSTASALLEEFKDRSKYPKTDPHLRSQDGNHKTVQGYRDGKRIFIRSSAFMDRLNKKFRAQWSISSPTVRELLQELQTQGSFLPGPRERPTKDIRVAGKNLKFMEFDATKLEKLILPKTKSHLKRRPQSS